MRIPEKGSFGWKLLNWMLGLIYLALFIYGLWHGGHWMYGYVVGLTPARLAILCLWVTGFPFILMFIFALAQENGAMHSMGMLAMVALSYITIPGLLISALWFLVTRSI